MRLDVRPIVAINARMPVIDVHDNDFESQVLRSQLPVLVDLFADWCQPCKALAPILDDIARELEGKLVVARLDVDKNPMVASSLQVQSIPMLILVHEGKLVDQSVGLVDKNALLKMVKPVLPASANEIDTKELFQLLKNNQVQPVDIRDAASFARYRIPQAQNIPAGQLDSRVTELSASDGKIRVLYGRSTEDAKELAEKLLAKGIQVGFLTGGFLHWEADGFEVERPN